VVVVAVVVVRNTLQYIGPFVYSSVTHDVLAAQLFIAVAAVSTLFFAAVVAERQTLADELVQSRARILQAADRERHRLERDLHDGVQQRLVALAIRIGQATQWPNQTIAALTSLLTQTQEQINLANSELRTVAHGLHPDVLTSHGLADAIKALARHSPVPVELRRLPKTRLPEPIEVTAYYLLAEALSNAQKHAHATYLVIEITTLPDRLLLRLTDNGRGGASQRPGGGLQGMRDRAETHAGTLTITSPPGNGTTITATLPL
jgi:signal transduction histidine kinase